MNRTLAFLIVLGAAMNPLGCRGIIGVEGHELIDKLSCENYCALMKVSCTGENLQYPADSNSEADTDEACMKMCALFEPGTLDDTEKNTLGCRIRVLDTFGKVDEPELCRSVGPVGEGLCGSSCEAYCKSLEALCPTLFASLVDDCMTFCGDIANCGGYVADSARDDNSLQCRVFHLTSASIDATTHCPHAIGVGHCEDTAPTCPASP